MGIQPSSLAPLFVGRSRVATYPLEVTVEALVEARSPTKKR
jgi:hypothetical protein